MKRLLEWLFHVVAFALQCNALVPLLSRNSTDVADLGTANPLNTLSMAFVLSTTLVLMLWRARTTLGYAPGMWPTLCLVLLAILSVAWSDYPATTFRRAGSLTTATLWAWYVTARYDLKSVILIITQSIGFLAFASLAVGLGAPGLGRGPDGWLGVFSTKNDLGTVMAIGTATCFYTLFIWRPRFFSFAFSAVALVLCLGLLYLSQSRTAWVVGLLGPILCVIIRLTHKRVGVGIIVWTAILLLLAPGVVLAMDQLGSITAMLGKDASLSGRVDLWLILPSYIMQRPWLGHGFAAFWVQDSVNVFQIWSAVGWEPPHAHNGWLDILLDLGFAGLALAAAQILLLVAKSVRAVIEGREADAQYVLLATFVILSHNLTESSLLRPGLCWVLLVVAATALAKIAKERQGAAVPLFARRFPRREPLAPRPFG